MKTSLFKAAACCLLLTAAAITSLQAQVIDKTPVLHMSFDNVSGTTVFNDGSGGSGMNGTLTGAGATVTGGGRYGNGLSISGAASSDAYCRIANAVVPLNGNANWSVAMWVKTATAGGAYAYQGGGGWGGGNSTFYLNNGGGAGTHAGGVRNSQGWVQGTSDVNDNTWHHIVVSCTGSARIVYVDGNPQSTNAGNWGGNGTGSEFRIGGTGTGEGDGQVNLNGMVDEVYVFNRTLSQSDIQALVDSNTVPVVPVSVTVNPTSGYRQTSFTVPATATPASGTVTNAIADLSALGLSASAPMVQSSPNVFTNTFTIPTNSAIGARNVKVTVIDTEPLAGSGGATFTVLAKPPTNAIVLNQLTNKSAYEYTETSFYFRTTNDAPDSPFPMNTD